MEKCKKKLNIGILTFHCANNFGAVLQCYALQKILEQTQNNIYIIDYRPNFLIKTTYLFPSINEFINNPVSSIKRSIKTFLYLKSRIQSINSFNKFRKENFCIYPYKKDSELCNKFNTIVIGSDQIWNIEITNGFDCLYWGDFTNSNINLITYAASTGRYIFNNNEIEVVKNKLRNFTNISVREIGLKEQIQNLYQNKVHLVLDPTLLLQKENYSNFFNEPLEKSKYILIYEVVHDNNTERIANLLAQETDSKIIRIGSHSKNKKIKDICNIGPSEFINYIYYAYFIVTTSFHGTAFSIILNKSFYTLKLGNKIDERANTLLTSINLENRHIQANSSPNYKTIDYKTINPMIDELRSESINFLLKSI